jgi:hypothetical protein
MVEKTITSPRNVIDFARYQQGRAAGRAQAISARLCRHCGAALADGENEEECSATFRADDASLRWQAAPGRASSRGPGISRFRVRALRAPE